MSSMDYANDSSVGKWAPWLRWILVIPTAILLPVVLIALQALASWFYGYEISSPYFRIVIDCIMGAGFVYGAVYMAPRYQLTVAIIFFSLILILCVLDAVAMNYGTEYYSLWELVRLAITVIAAGSVLYTVAKKLSDSTTNNP